MKQTYIRKSSTLIALVGLIGTVAAFSAPAAHAHGNYAVVTNQKWFGTAPFCKGQCPAGWRIIASSKTGGGRKCWRGVKLLCERVSGRPACHSHTFRYTGPRGGLRAAADAACGFAWQSGRIRPTGGGQLTVSCCPSS